MNITKQRQWCHVGFALTLIYALSGCTVTPSSEPLPVNAHVTTAASDETQQANALRNRPDQYLLHKKTMTATQLAHFTSALDWLNQGQAEKAREALSAVTTGPDLTSALWVLRGDIALKLGETQAATQFYNQATTVNPYNYFALNRLGIRHREMGQFKRARDYYAQAITAWPGYAMSYYNAGILHDLYLGDKAAAITAYERYLMLIDGSKTAKADKKHINKIKRWIADVKRQQAVKTQENG